jgi:hypothetical protein
MSATIRESVGINGKNRPDDVIVVQSLLNRIAPAKGGPSVKLKVDGKAGPKTKNAIQTFQLEHFGWKGADGRVDPNGPTLAKLNELAGPPTPDSPVGPIVGGSFVVRQATAAAQMTNPNNDFFFEVQDVVGKQRVRYIFVPIGRPLPGFVPTVFPGPPLFFAAAPPVSILALGGPASYVTDFSSGKPRSFLMFTGQHGTRVLALQTHLPKGAGKKLGGVLGQSTSTREEITGVFIFG